jgi:hypothetical protein
MEIYASDGSDDNGANWGTMQASGRISAKFQNVASSFQDSGVPS